MVKPVISGAPIGRTISEKEKRERGLAGQTDVGLPSEGLGLLGIDTEADVAVDTGPSTPEISIARAPEAPISGTTYEPSEAIPTSPVQAAEDPLQTLLGVPTVGQATSPQPVQRAVGTAPGTPQGVQPASPLREDVVAIDIPKVGTQAEGTRDPFGEFGVSSFQPQAARETLYGEQISREQIPSFDTVDELIQARTQKRAEEGSGFQLITEEDLDPAFVDNLDTDSAASFDSASVTLGRGLTNQAKKNPRLGQIMDQAGVLRDGEVDPQAARALLFTTLLEHENNKQTNSSKTSELASRVDLFNKGDKVNGISEAEVDQQLQWLVSQPDFDRQRSQYSLANRFQQVYKGLGGANVAGTVVDPSLTRSPLSPQDQSLFAVAVLDQLTSQGLLSEVDRLNPADGQRRAGYSVDMPFELIGQGIRDIIGQVSDKFRTDVSLVPLPGGVPVGHGTLSHRAVTRSPGKAQKVLRSSVYKAMDIAGKMPMSVSTDALGGNALAMALVKQDRLHDFSQKLNEIMGEMRNRGIRLPWSSFRGFSNNPLAGHFLLDAATFFKYIPSGSDVVKQHDAEMKHFDKASQAEAERTGVPSTMQPPYLSEVASKNYPDLKTLETTVNDLAERASTGFDQEAERDLVDLMVRRIVPALKIQGLVSKNYLDNVADGARLQDKTFYFPQTAQAGSTRIQLGTNTLNYQASKKARGLIANPVKYHITGRDFQEVVKRRASDKRQRVFEAIIARNLSGVSLEAEGASFPKTERMASIEHQSDALRDHLHDNGTPTPLARLAIKVSEASPDKTSVENWSRSLKEYKETALSQGVDPNRIRPDSSDPSVSREFPTLGGVDLNNFTPKEVGYLAHVMDLGTWKGEEFTPSGKSDHGDFIYRSLKALGDYLTKRSFHTDITVEPDSISSGIAIQAYQFGDQDLLKHSAVLYSDPKNVTPDGDARDYVHKSITEPRVSLGDMSVVQQLGHSEQEMNILKKVYGQDGIIDTYGKQKDLHKKGAMTISYAQEAGAAAQGSVEEFFQKNAGGEVLNEVRNELRKLPGLGPNATEAEIQEFMGTIEKRALGHAFGSSINHAKAVTNGSQLARALNEIYTIEGANGVPVQMGGFRTEELAQEQYLGVGDRPKVVTTYRTVGDPAAKAKHGGFKGQTQSAVTPTHNIDATIAQETVIDIHNKLYKFRPANVPGAAHGERTKESQGLAWTGQVFDAFLGDVGSYEQIIESANNKFKQVNDRYSLLGAHLDAVQGLRKKAKELAAQKKVEGGTFDVTPEGEYSGMYHLLIGLRRGINSIRKSGLEGANMGSLDIKQAEKLLYGKLKFDVDGVQMRPAEFVNAFEVLVASMSVLEVLNEQIKHARSNKAKTNELVQDQLREVIADEFSGVQVPRRPIRNFG